MFQYSSFGLFNVRRAFWIFVAARKTRRHIEDRSKKFARQNEFCKKNKRRRRAISKQRNKYFKIWWVFAIFFQQIEIPSVYAISLKLSFVIFFYSTLHCYIVVYIMSFVCWTYADFLITIFKCTTSFVSWMIVWCPTPLMLRKIEWIAFVISDAKRNTRVGKKFFLFIFPKDCLSRMINPKKKEIYAMKKVLRHLKNVSNWIRCDPFPRSEQSKKIHILYLHTAGHFNLQGSFGLAENCKSVRWIDTSRL